MPGLLDAVKSLTRLWRRRAEDDSLLAPSPPAARDEAPRHQPITTSDLVQALERVAAELAEKRKRTTDLPQLMNRTAKALQQLERWRAGYAGVIAALYEDYHAQLCKIIEHFRQARQCDEALRVWVLLRKTSAETNAVVDALALDLVRVPTRTLSPEVSLIVLEALHCTQDQEVVRELRQVFERCRIDWSEPDTDEVKDRLALLHRLRGLGGLVPDDLQRQFAFWEAMGNWRCAETPAYAELIHVFGSLVDAEPDNSVYQWCRVRLLYENAVQLGDGKVALHREWQAWRGPDEDKTDVVAGYFQALIGKEKQLGRRRSLPSLVVLPEDFGPMLSRRLRILEGDAKLDDHVRPIRECVIVQHS